MWWYFFVTYLMEMYRTAQQDILPRVAWTHHIYACSQINSNCRVLHGRTSSRFHTKRSSSQVFSSQGEWSSYEFSSQLEETILDNPHADSLDVFLHNFPAFRKKSQRVIQIENGGNMLAGRIYRHCLRSELYHHYTNGRCSLSSSVCCRRIPIHCPLYSPMENKGK